MGLGRAVERQLHEVGAVLGVERSKDRLIEMQCEAMVGVNVHSVVCLDDDGTVEWCVCGLDDETDP